MNDINISLSILDPLYVLFSWFTRIFYNFFGNYGVAIIVLTVFIRALLIPLNIKSQKSMIKMQALSGKTAELQRKYGHDKQKYNEELMKLQQENGAMSFSGCLLPFLQILFIWPIYRIVSGPLRYISGVSVDNIGKLIDMGGKYGLDKNVSVVNHIGLIDKLTRNSEYLREAVSAGLIKVGDLLDLSFLGLDLGKTPAYNPVTIIRDPKTYVPLLIIPILVVLTNIISMRLTEVLKPDYKELKEARKREKINAARAGQTPKDQNESMMKAMTWTMPIIMLITTFTLPAAMGLYWVIGGIMGILTQVIVYFMFTKPYALKKKEMEEKKKLAFKKSGNESETKKKKNKK